MSLSRNLVTIGTVLGLWLALVLGCAPPREASQSSDPALELLSHRQRQRTNFSVISGEVRNISNRDLAYTKVIAEYRDQVGNFILMNEIYINNWRSFPPGETSAFEIMTSNVPREAVAYTLRFMDGGREIPIRDSSAPPQSPSPRR